MPTFWTSTFIAIDMIITYLSISTGDINTIINIHFAICTSETSNTVTGVGMTSQRSSTVTIILTWSKKTCVINVGAVNTHPVVSTVATVPINKIYTSALVLTWRGLAIINVN